MAAVAKRASPADDDRRGFRVRVLALLFAATILNFVDRQALSIVAPVLRDELGFSNRDYGLIVAAFQLGMLLGELPMGWLMDRRGPRFGLAFAVLLWSFANGLHAAAGSVATLAAFRLMLGLGECGNYSGGVKLIAQHFVVKDRAFAIGVFNSASMAGSMVAMATIPFVALRFGWRAAFLLPSTLGLVWAVVWLTTYRPAASAADVEAPGAAHAVTFRALLALPQTWGLVACRFLAGPVVQLYLYWTPEILYRRHGLSLAAIGAFAWLPFVFGDVGSLAGGWAAARLIARGASVARARTTTLLVGATLCLASTMVAAARGPSLALAGIALVLLGHTFLSANMFAAIGDVFPPRAAGRVTALTGIAGGASGMLFPWLTGLIVDRGSYVPVFLVAASLPLAGVVALLVGARGFLPVAAHRLTS